MIHVCQFINLYHLSISCVWVIRCNKPFPQPWLTRKKAQQQRMAQLERRLSDILLRPDHEVRQCWPRFVGEVNFHLWKITWDLSWFVKMFLIYGKNLKESLDCYTAKKTTIQKCALQPGFFLTCYIIIYYMYSMIYKHIFLFLNRCYLRLCSRIHCQTWCFEFQGKATLKSQKTLQTCMISNFSIHSLVLECHEKPIVFVFTPFQFHSTMISSVQIFNNSPSSRFQGSAVRDELELMQKQLEQFSAEAKKLADSSNRNSILKLT